MLVRRGSSRWVAAVAAGLTAVLVAATVPAAASSGQARPRAATTWDAQTLPALPGSAGSGLLFTPLTGVVVPLRTTGVSTSTEPTLEVDQLNVANVQFRVESLLTGRVQSSSNVRVDGGRARWLVPRGVLELAQNYQVSLIDAANTRNVVFAERNLHVDPQRSDEQKQWPFGGVSVAKVTGEPMVNWSSTGLSTLGGVAGFSLVHRPTNFAQNGLPAGWQLLPSSVGSRWRTLTLSRNGSVARLTAVDGWTVAFERVAGGSFVAQLGEHDGWPAGQYSTLNANPGGGWTVTNTNMSTTSFPAANTGSTVTLYPSAVWTDGSPVLQQTWVNGRLDRVTDPVSGRRIKFVYGPSGRCAAPADGFVAVPAGMLCAASLWDGTDVAVSYVSTNAGVQIGRITGHAGEGTSAAVTDLGWDRSARITGIRQPLVAAATAAAVVGGLTNADERGRTTVGYDSSGRVTTITAPAGLVSGNVQTAAQTARPSQTLEYSRTTRSGAGGGVRAVFTVRQAGVSVPFVEQAEATLDRMDETRVTGPANQGTVTSYNADDQATEVLDVASGTRSRTEYDAQGRAVRALGPSRRPLTSNSGVPEIETRYDTVDADPGPGVRMQPLTGLVLISWDNTGLTGQPADRSVGPRVAGTVPQTMAFGWPSNPSGNGGAWSGRLAGKFVADAAGTYSFRSDARARQFLVNGRPCTTQVPCEVQLARGGAAELQAEVVSVASGAASVNLEVAGANRQWRAIRSTETNPGLNQVTEQVVTEQLAGNRGAQPVRQVSEYDYTSGSGNLVRQTSESGASVSHTWDTYTGRDGHYGQHLSWTGPDGRTTTYGYHNATAPAAGCDGPAVQGGLLASTTRPGGTTTEQSYNAAGSTSKAAGQGTETCINYRADGSASGGTVTGDGAPYSASNDPIVSGNPLISSATVTAQGLTTTTRREISITGQTVRSTDGHGTVTTTTYDPWTGHVTSATETTAAGDSRTTNLGYDQFGRQTTVTVNGTVLSTSRYLSDGRVDRVTYANGTTSATTDDANNNTDSVTYGGFAGGATVGETATYSRDNAILSRTLRGTNGTARFDATYNLDHRLVSSVASGTIPRTTNSTTVAFEGLAGANGNRTSQTVVDAAGRATTSTFTYDTGDRLVATTAPGVGAPSYDVHGRTTATGAGTLAYDAGGTPTALTGPKGSMAFTGDGDAVFTAVGGATPVTLRPSGNLLLDEGNRIVGQLVSLPQGVTVALDATGNQVAWQYNDLQGSTAWETTGNAAPAATTVYDPWGTQISTNTRAVPATPIGLALSMNGWKGTTRLPVGDDFYAMGNREYSPATGRFLQRDPLVGGSTNSYDALLGDPLNVTDSDGNSPIGKLIGFVVSAVAGAILSIATAGAYAAIAASSIGATWAAYAASFAVGAVAGAITGFAGSAAEQAYDNNGDVDYQQAGARALIGGAIGGLGGALQFGVVYTEKATFLKNKWQATVEQVRGWSASEVNDFNMSFGDWDMDRDLTARMLFKAGLPPKRIAYEGLKSVVVQVAGSGATVAAGLMVPPTGGAGGAGEQAPGLNPSTDPTIDAGSDGAELLAEALVG